MLDRLAASTHRIRICVEPRLHGFDNVLVLPPRDAALRSLRALSLQRAGGACVGPVFSFFFVAISVSELGLSNPTKMATNFASLIALRIHRRPPD